MSCVLWSTPAEHEALLQRIAQIAYSRLTVLSSYLLDCFHDTERLGRAAGVDVQNWAGSDVPEIVFFWSAQ